MRKLHEDIIIHARHSPHTLMKTKKSNQANFVSFYMVYNVCTFTNHSGVMNEYFYRLNL